MSTRPVKRRDSAQTFIYGIAATFLGLLLATFIAGLIRSVL